MCGSASTLSAQLLGRSCFRLLASVFCLIMAWNMIPRKRGRLVYKSTKFSMTEKNKGTFQEKDFGPSSNPPPSKLNVLINEDTDFGDLLGPQLNSWNVSAIPSMGLPN